ALKVENLALRHQLAVLRRSAKRQKLITADRLLWAWLSQAWVDWRLSLLILKPETVIGWHRKGFRMFWTWKVRRGKPGRPTVPKDVRKLIRKLSRENPLWGAPRIHGELLKLGVAVGETSVAKYMPPHRHPPSQTWRTFLENHLHSTVSVDFFTVPTIRFQVLYVFLVLAHDRRRIVHFNVTSHPTAEWTAQQLREAFPFDQAPQYLLRDRRSSNSSKRKARLLRYSCTASQAMPGCRGFARGSSFEEGQQNPRLCIYAKALPPRAGDNCGT